MEELHELIKYLKDNGYSRLKVNPDLLVGIIEYFASKQETKQCTITDVSQQRELLIAELKKWDLGWTSFNNLEEKLAEELLKSINCG